MRLIELRKGNEGKMCRIETPPKGRVVWAYNETKWAAKWQLRGSFRNLFHKSKGLDTPIYAEFG